MNRLDKLSKRIEALEGENRRSPREQWPTPDDWLESFKEFGEESGKAKDPDFQAALAALASAIEEAKRNPDKPYEPPAKNQSEMDNARERFFWQWNNPALSAAMDRLGVFLGIPPMKCEIMIESIPKENATHERA